MALHFVIVILLGMLMQTFVFSISKLHCEICHPGLLTATTSLSLQHPMYQDVAARFNLTSDLFNVTHPECIIGRMEMRVFNEYTEVTPGQDNLPYNVNLTMGVMVQNAYGELADLVYTFEGDNSGSVVPETPPSNVATIRLVNDGKARQRFTVLVEGKGHICPDRSIRCVGMDWIDFGTAARSSGYDEDDDDSDIYERTLQNRLAFKLACRGEHSHMKKSELSSDLVVKSEDVTNGKSEDENPSSVSTEVETGSIRKLAVMISLSSYMWFIVLLIAVLMVVFCVQLIGVHRARKASRLEKQQQQQLPNAVRDRIISGRGGNGRSYKVSEGEQFSLALLAKISPSTMNQTIESGNDCTNESDDYIAFPDYVCYSPLTVTGSEEPLPSFASPVNAEE